MGIEFHLARNDHRVVEEFLATSPAGVTTISVDAHHRARQANAIEAARVAGVRIRIEPLTERLFDPGFHVGGLPYVRDRPYIADRLAMSARERHQLIEDTAIRSRLACRIGHCGSDIRGPLVDARSHYLHARASEWRCWKTNLRPGDPMASGRGWNALSNSAS